MLLEVLVGLDLAVGLTDSVLTSVDSPHELDTSAKGLVAPRERCEDRELAISTDHDETAVAAVLQLLGKDFTRSQLLGGQGQSLSIRNLSFISHIPSLCVSLRFLKREKKKNEMG